MKKISRVVRADSINHDRLFQALHDVDQFVPAKADEKWFSIIRIAPANLRSALLLELKSGNRVAELSYTNWPQKGSVVMRVESRFKNEWIDNTLGVKYCFINDPHYWEEQVSQTIDGVWHLIISPFGESEITVSRPRVRL